MAFNCRSATKAFNSVITTELGAAQFRELSRRGASPMEVGETVAAYCDDATANIIREEIRELPRSFTSLLLTLWHMADESGQTFEMVSEPAPKPLEYARSGRVAYRIEHDVDGVRMYVSHVHGHHADWFKPELEAAAV